MLRVSLQRVFQITVTSEVALGQGEQDMSMEGDDCTQIQDMVEQTLEKYKRLDVLVYNSGAIWWASVEKTPMRRFQLMQRIGQQPPLNMHVRTLRPGDPEGSEHPLAGQTGLRRAYGTALGPS